MKTFSNQEMSEAGYGNVTVFGNGEYDGCAIGISTSDQAIYSLTAMIEWLMARDGIDYDEALDAIQYNAIGSLGGSGSKPVILDDTGLLFQE